MEVRIHLLQLGTCASPCPYIGATGAIGASCWCTLVSEPTRHVSAHSIRHRQGDASEAENVARKKNNHSKATEIQRLGG
jgi:hypothetical protein